MKRRVMKRRRKKAAGNTVGDWMLRQNGGIVRDIWNRRWAGYHGAIADSRLFGERKRLTKVSLPRGAVSLTSVSAESCAT